MKKEEKKALKEIMKASFPFLARPFFSITPHTFVAEREGELLGGIVLNIFPLKEGLGGLVGWIFTHQKARGQEVGRSLLDRALEYFSEKGVNQVFACVEGYNTSSLNLFQNQGFSLLSPGTQWKTFGLQTPFIWYYCQHLMDIGHFLLARPAQEKNTRSHSQWWGSLLINSLLFLLALWRQGNLERTFLYLVPLTFLLYLGVRDLAMNQAGRLKGVSLGYRAWESGFVLVGGMALALGGFFPNPGSRYPLAKGWKYREYRSVLGYMGLWGILGVVITTVLLIFIQKSTLISSHLRELLSYPIYIGKILGLMDTILIIFPVSSFNGRRVFDFNRTLWFLLLLFALLPFFL